MAQRSPHRATALSRWISTISASVALLAASLIAPPSAGAADAVPRLEGVFTVNQEITELINVKDTLGRKSTVDYTFTPACSSGSCETRVDRVLSLTGAPVPPYTVSPDATGNYAGPATRSNNCYSSSGALVLANAYVESETTTLTATATSGGRVTSFTGKVVTDGVATEAAKAAGCSPNGHEVTVINGTFKPPANNPPVFTTTPGPDAIHPPVVGSSSVVIAASDPEGGPITLSTAKLPTSPVRVVCARPESNGASASTRCVLKQVAGDGAPIDITFTATDAQGLSANYTMIVSPGQYVALGDSFSSGEGNPPYYAGTNLLGKDMCHRSTQAYPKLVDDVLPSLRDESEFLFEACSGATVATLTLGNLANSEPSQYQALTPATTLVTLSIGGNDADFADILKQCTAGALSPGSLNCLAEPYKGSPTLTSRLATLKSELSQDIRCPSNNGDRCDALLNKQQSAGYTAPALHGVYEEVQRKAPNAKIVVLLYPHLFTDNPTASNPNMSHALAGQYKGGTSPGQLVCRVGSVSGDRLNLAISAETMMAFNKGVDDVDQIILDQVALARRNGVNIVAADPRPAFNQGPRGGHGLCGGTSWINTVSLGKQGWSAGARPESFHPDKKGHAAFSLAVLQAIRN